VKTLWPLASTAAIWPAKCAIVASARALRRCLATQAAGSVLPFDPAGDEAGPHRLQVAQPTQRRRGRPPGERAQHRAVFANMPGIDGVGLVVSEPGAGEVANLRRIDDANDVAGGVQRQGDARL